MFTTLGILYEAWFCIDMLFKELFRGRICEFGAQSIMMTAWSLSTLGMADWPTMRLLAEAAGAWIGAHFPLNCIFFHHFHMSSPIFTHVLVLEMLSWQPEAARKPTTSGPSILERPSVHLPLLGTLRAIYYNIYIYVYVYCIPFTADLDMSCTWSLLVPGSAASYGPWPAVPRRTESRGAARRVDVFFAPRGPRPLGVAVGEGAAHGLGRASAVSAGERAL